MHPAARRSRRLGVEVPLERARKFSTATLWLVLFQLGCNVDDRSFAANMTGASTGAGGDGNPDAASDASAGARGNEAGRGPAGGGGSESGTAASAGSESGDAGGTPTSDGNDPDGGSCVSSSSFELACADQQDDDCDGSSDCADEDCAGARCGVSELSRCCDGACVDTGTSAEHCQGCGLACAAGEACVLVSDESGVRGHCTCFASTDCPGYPNTICRKDNGDGQDDLCACDFEDAINAGCAAGQVCADVPRANFCRYPSP